jgi:hypothetical protein
MLWTGFMWLKCGGRYRCANTSPILISACGFTHWTRWRYRALELVASWTQWSPTARGVASIVWPRSPSCLLLQLLLWDCCSFSGIPLVVGIPGSQLEPVTLPEWWNRVQWRFKRLAPNWSRPNNKGSPVARSQAALWEAPTSVCLWQAFLTVLIILWLPKKKCEIFWLVVWLLTASVV